MRNVTHRENKMIQVYTQTRYMTAPNIATSNFLPTTNILFWHKTLVTLFVSYCFACLCTYCRRDYERALHINPSCLSARVNLAYNLQVSGRYQLAWHQFTAAINTDPSTLLLVL